MIKEFNTLQYKGYDEFSCIGDKCKHTCCAGWRIDIDANTYKKYKLNSYFSKDIMKNNFIENKDKSVKMKLNENKLCNFLDDKGLCDIHAKLGEDFLCKTCKVYPRGMNLVDGGMEKHIFTSCPPMVEMFIMRDEQISFDSVVKSTELDSMSLKLNIETTKSNYMKYFWDIRMFSISLLQNRDFDIEKRLIILGMFCKKIEETKDIDNIPEIIKQYSKFIQSKDGFGDIDELNIDISKKCNLILGLVPSNLNSNLKELMVNLKELLGDYKLYEKLEKVKFGEFKNDFEYILENYLVNATYSSCMPYSERDSVLDSYIGLVAQYAMIKLYLIGLKKEKIDKESFVSVVSLASRSINHNNYKLEDIIMKCVDEETSLIGLIITLIR